MDEVRVHLWNGTMALGRQKHLKAIAEDDDQYRLEWYGSGYDRDPWAPGWVRSNDPHEVIARMRCEVEAEPQYPWREMPPTAAVGESTEA